MFICPITNRTKKSKYKVSRIRSKVTKRFKVPQKLNIIKKKIGKHKKMSVKGYRTLIKKNMY